VAADVIDPVALSLLAVVDPPALIDSLPAPVASVALTPPVTEVVGSVSPAVAVAVVVPPAVAESPRPPESPHATPSARSETAQGFRVAETERGIIPGW